MRVLAIRYGRKNRRVPQFCGSLRRRDLRAGPGTDVSFGRLHVFVAELFLRFSHVGGVSFVSTGLGP